MSMKWIRNTSSTSLLNGQNLGEYGWAAMEWELLRPVLAIGQTSRSRKNAERGQRRCSRISFQLHTNAMIGVGVRLGTEYTVMASRRVRLRGPTRTRIRVGRLSNTLSVCLLLRHCISTAAHDLWTMLLTPCPFLHR